MREQEGIRLFMILKNNKSQCDKKIALVMIVSTPSDTWTWSDTGLAPVLLRLPHGHMVSGEQQCVV